MMVCVEALWLLMFAYKLLCLEFSPFVFDQVFALNYQSTLSLELLLIFFVTSLLFVGIL